MSLKVMSAVWESNAGPAVSRMVLLALADFADDSGKAWPSINAIAKRCAISARSVNRCIAELEANGHLERERRFNNSNMYKLTPRTEPTPDTASGGDTTSPPDRMSPPPDNVVRSRPDNVGALTVNEPSMNRQKGTSPDDDGFTSWWTAYPKKSGKLVAEKSYVKALKHVDAETLLAAAKAYSELKSEEDKRFILNPATWLNQGHWEDEDLTIATPNSVSEWIRECWKKYDTQSIEHRSGLKYERPDIPETAADPRAYVLADRRSWIEANRDRIIASIIAKESSAA